MKRILIALVGSLLVTVAHAGTAFFKHEINTGGMTKQCVYDYLGSTYIITVSSISICPLSIKV